MAKRKYYVVEILPLPYLRASWVDNHVGETFLVENGGMYEGNMFILSPRDKGHERYINRNPEHTRIIAKSYDREELIQHVHNTLVVGGIVNE